MAVYKFKISFEDFEDVYRVIEIKSSQTFLDFHKAILASIGFDEKHLGSFFMSNDSWKKGQEITLEEMTDNPENPIPTMAQSKLSKFIVDPHQKILYVYDFLEVWAFNIELAGISITENADIKYPNCVKSNGLAPKQYDKFKKTGKIIEDEFDEIANSFQKGVDMHTDEISEDEADEFGLFDDNLEEEAQQDSDSESL